MAERTVPTRTDRRTEIIGAARALLDAEGPEALSMRRIADRIGIRAASLYKHFPDKAAIEAALQAQGMAETADALEAAEADAPRGPSVLLELALAYRAYAVGSPHLYRLTSAQPLARHALPDGLEDRAAMPLMRAVRGNTDVARAFYAFAHGMVMLEIDGRFPPGADLDAAWHTGCETFAAVIAGTSTDED